MADLDKFLQACCKVQSDGMIASDGAAWRLGAVLFCWSGAGVAAVRKAYRPGYEFSGLHALPGGMIRAGSHGADVNCITSASLTMRASAETGLVIGQRFSPSGLGPVVTRYKARGAMRLTLIAAFRTHVADSPPLNSRDDSITDAAWLALPIDFSCFAPANQIILAHLLWPELADGARGAAERSIRSALTLCAAAAESAGLPQPAAPWDPQKRIDDWRQSWPSLQEAHGDARPENAASDLS